MVKKKQSYSVTQTLIVQFHGILGLIGDNKTTVNISSGFTNDIEMVHFEVKG